MTQEVDENTTEILDLIEDERFPVIPDKHYFSIGEISRLCRIKPNLLRSWEHEFPQLKNVKRRGNRRYYTRQQVITVRHIKNLLIKEGVSIENAKMQIASSTLSDQQEHHFLSDNYNPEQTLSPSIISKIKKELEDLLHLMNKKN
ncbi:MAG: MerR family transcriptional regulator [Endozoicomonadaceae bacterium]|nr:MerR family transcriptional regulator [Endozoicomonadaceae bacterium]